VQTQQRQNRIPFPAGPATERASRPAAEYAAIFPTRLALERWRRGGDVPHVFASRNTPSRAAWFEQARSNFQSWLEDGGFHGE
jgi:hypothetical protein